MNQNRTQSKPTDSEQRSGKGLSSSVLLGVPPDPECAVVDNNGKHCPESPTMLCKVDGQELPLCPRCYEAASIGAYGEKAVVVIREISSPNDLLNETLRGVQFYPWGGGKRQA